jgi:signal peptidase I
MRDRPEPPSVSRGDDSDDPVAEDEDDEAPPRRSRRTHPRTARRSSPPRPVRRWKGGGDEPEDDEEVDGSASSGRRRWLHRDDHPVYWRARDSLYFEPLVAVAIIVVLVAGLYAYTQNWPPVYVVESDSMQHGSSDILGLINTGDLVLAQKVDPSQITTYVFGLRTGYSTYGEYGDVLLYEPNGISTTPIIHRAILFLAYNPATEGYNASFPAGTPCGSEANAVYNLTPTPTGPQGCADTSNLRDTTLTLYNIGWMKSTVTVDLSPGLLGAHSGYLTMGDNNYAGCTGPASGQPCTGLPDQTTGRSTLVEPGWVIGVARGMLPWFGALKLALEGNAGMVPAQSWQFLGITIAALILLAFGVHYALRAEGVEDPRRKAEEEEAEDDEEPERPPGRARRFLQGLRPWSREPEDDVDDVPARRSTRSPSRPLGRPPHRGRPAPRVRRTKRKKSASDDSDDDL